MKAKINLIQGAYSQMRISGISLAPSPEDLVLALNRLESMMWELRGRNVCLNYNREEIPDSNSLHNVERTYWYSLEVLLAVRLLVDFGKPVPPTLAMAETAASSFLFSATATVMQVLPSERMPIGSGNTFHRVPYYRFFKNAEQVPADCTVHKMFLGDINDYSESFESTLHSGETIDDYVLEAEGGLNIISTYRSDESIFLTVQAIGGTKEVLRIKLTINTTPDNRQLSRFITFTIDERALSLEFQQTGVVYTVVHDSAIVLHVNAPVLHVLL